MKVLAIIGSARKDGTISKLARVILKGAKENG
ncbi:MAG: NAD(P)H-dependent oxidoreductase [Promethearchaeota archaeon]